MPGTSISGMSVKSTVFKVILGLVLACLLICLAVAVAFLFWIHSWGLYSSFGTNFSKDDQLIAIFHAHQAAFEKLQQMAAEDVRNGWYLGLSDTDKISESRRQEYTNYVSQIHPGLDVTLDGYGDGMRFIFAGGGTGLLGPGWVKGIEYVPGGHEVNGAIYSNDLPPWQGMVDTNLDKAQSLPANVYLRPIGTNWFVFYQRDEG